MSRAFLSNADLRGANLQGVTGLTQEAIKRVTAD
jgi:uncharacterized protein YjbI with pentapeptide repeats